MVTRETAINTANSFLNDCKTSGLTFHKVLLFGSAAKDMTHEWSDIDLLLISDQFSNNVFDNLKLYSKINIKYPIIETHPYPTKYYNEGDDFIQEISKDSIELVAPAPNTRS
jgi:predicted nucleotidyltransferase